MPSMISARRTYATEAGEFRLITLVGKRRAELTGTPEQKDLVIIGGGVAGYVAAIKAGQEGLKV
jgi:NADPH-dependent 2,4-dienoyl-CoA reductase/sulfur reductase-like enzyme